MSRSVEFKDKLEGLNKSQREAVIASGPLLVIAGAGTGKTELITRKITYLIESGKAKPNEILALTFTEKAASEMLGRVDELSSYIYPDVVISTFHGFGEQILRDHAYEIGLTSDFSVLTDAEQLLYLRDNLFSLNLERYLPKSNPTAFLSSMAENFARAKDELVTADEYLATAKKMESSAKTPEERETAKNTLEVARAYGRYLELTFESGYLDWGDLLYLSHQILTTKPAVLKKWQDRFKYVLVDEFQDTNHAQYELIKLLVPGGKGLTVVGDDDQAIYSFRGAGAYNTMTFLNDHKKAKTITLLENYRNSQSILDFSHSFIKHNDPDRLEAKIDISKRLNSNTGKGVVPRLKLHENAQAEGNAIAEEIAKLNESGLSYKDIAVLTRTNKQAEPIIRALTSAGIPNIFSGNSGLYSREEVRIARALLESVADPDENLALYHLAVSEAYGISVEKMAAALHKAKNMNRSLLFTLKEEAGGDEEIASLLEDLNYYRELSRKESAGQVLNAFLKRSGYLKRLVEQQDEGDAAAANKIIALSSFFDRIIEFQNSYRDHSIQKFVEFIRLMLEVGEDPKTFEADPSIDAVRILTMHQAKGLEFEAVFVSSLSDSHIPGRRRADRIPLPPTLLKEEQPEGDEHLLEERRLFYVALTRAKNHLILTAALDYGTKRTHKISRFVLEAMPDAKIKDAFTKSIAVEKLNYFELTDDQGLTFSPLPSGKLSLSATKIDAYNSCPLKYKFLHVIPIRTVPDQSLAYGNAVHNTISEYFKRRLSGKKPGLDELLEIFDSKWSSQGFLSLEHEIARKDKGRISIEEFYKKFSKREVPHSFEESFKFGIDDAVIEGRYDMIDVIDGKVTIVDFKTSDTVQTQEKADERTKGSDQLKIYAYAYLKAHDKLPDQVSLYFTETGLVGVYNPSMKDMEKIEELIKSAIAGIRASDFRATPSLMTCTYCPFRFYCNYAVLEKRTGS